VTYSGTPTPTPSISRPLDFAFSYRRLATSKLIASPGSRCPPTNVDSRSRRTT
jgi:hypothetical protein